MQRKALAESRQAYISTWVVLFGIEAICGGLCHARNPKTKIKTKPADRARPYRGARGPFVDSMVTAGARWRRE